MFTPTEVEEINRDACTLALTDLLNAAELFFELRRDISALCVVRAIDGAAHVHLAGADFSLPREGE